MYSVDLELVTWNDGMGKRINVNPELKIIICQKVEIMIAFFNQTSKQNRLVFIKVFTPHSYNNLLFK